MERFFLSLFTGWRTRSLFQEPQRSCKGQGLDASKVFPVTLQLPHPHASQDSALTVSLNNLWPNPQLELAQKTHAGGREAQASECMRHSTWPRKLTLPGC